PEDYEEQINCPLDAWTVVVIPEQQGTERDGGKASGQREDGDALFEFEPGATTQCWIEVRKCRGVFRQLNRSGHANIITQSLASFTFALELVNRRGQAHLPDLELLTLESSYLLERPSI